MESVIYPEVHINESGNEVKIATTLRKKHNGKYYLQDFVERSRLSDTGEREWEMMVLLNKLHTQVYYAMIAGKVYPKLKAISKTGEEIYLFKKDKCQTPEKERLISKLPL